MLNFVCSYDRQLCSLPLKATCGDGRSERCHCGAKLRKIGAYPGTARPEGHAENERLSSERDERDFIEITDHLIIDLVIIPLHFETIFSPCKAVSCRCSLYSAASSRQSVPGQEGTIELLFVKL